MSVPEVVTVTQHEGADDQHYEMPLPIGCPPGDAQPPGGERYYRLVVRFPPDEHDFAPFRELNPNKPVKDECEARAVSVFETPESCRELIKLPTYKRKAKLCVAFPLEEQSGKVKQTSENPHHYSWWRARGFDVVGKAERVSEG